MATEDRPRAAMTQNRPAQAPEIPEQNANPNASVRWALSDGEAILVHGLRLLQRVKTGGATSVVDRSALSAVSGLLDQLQADFRDVLEEGDSKSKKRSGSRSTGKSRSQSPKRNSSAESELE